MNVRARIWSTQRTVPVRSRFSSRHTYPFGWRANERTRVARTWHYEVTDSRGNVILYDNTGDYQKILRAALIRVEALRHMEIAGHNLKPYKGSR